MLIVKKISKNFGLIPVLSEVSFALGKGDKAALVGRNGVGKTTLLKIIAGLDESDSGTVEIQKNAGIGYLTQDTSIMGTDSILDYLKNTIASSNWEKSFSHRAHVILSGFGFKESDLVKSMSILSSGQKVKVALSAILLKGVDLLLLDEPTNNLDLPSLIWLEDFLRNSEAAAIIVSHDRRFLDKVTGKIIEIDGIAKSVTVTGGKYSDYLEASIKRVKRAQETYRLQQEEIERLTAEVRRKKMEAERGSKWKGSDNDKFLKGFKRERSSGAARQAKTIEKRIEQIEKVERPIEKDPLEIPLEAPVNPGTLHISLDAVMAGYSGGFSIGPVSLDIRFGNRIGIMGVNGSGKSTLLKTLTGIIPPLSGSIEIGSGICIGNMMQEHEIVPKNKTPVEFLEDEGNLSIQDSYAKLSKFGIGAQQARKPIGELSPGARARLILAFFSAVSVNVLVLDEPTNHLDIEAVQALEETLSLYTGTVILVSHDRYFLEKAKLDTVYLITDSKFSRVEDYDEYIESMEKRAEKLLKALRK